MQMLMIGLQKRRSCRSMGLILAVCGALILLTRSANACFNNRIGCIGDTPSIDPLTFPAMFKRNKKTVLKTKAAFFSKFADKVWFKDYCKEKNVSFIENIAVFNQSDYMKIHPEMLPQSYILKSNKGSTRNIVVRNGMLMGNAGGESTGRSAVEVWPLILNRISHWGEPYVDVFGNVTEPWYEHILPKIIVEHLIDPLPDDIRIFVVNKTVELIFYNYGAASDNTNIYDAEFNLLPYRPIFPRDPIIDSKEVAALKNPTKIAAMHATALRLAEDIPLDIVRIDLYHINDTFYGSEITLCSFNGGKFIRFDKHHSVARNRNDHKKVHKPSSKQLNTQ